ncbi:MAG TPA: hypothetical protein VLZ12_16320, partial [Verrucomicrobiae bacterium]|nr:hypothetical protein [Verrucomicrobiae bacterium]
GGTVLSANLVIGLASATCDNWVQLDSGNLFVTNVTGDATLEVRTGKLILNGGVLRADRLVMTNACGLFVRNGGTLTVGTVLLRPDLDADGDGIPNIWEQTYGLDPLNAADANVDSGNGQTNLQVFQLTGNLDDDGDGFTHLQELIAGTDSDDSASYPHITSVAQQGGDVEIDWMAVGGHSYAVQTNATVDAGFTDVSPVIAMPGVGPTATNYLDLGGATNTPSFFYRVRLVP